MDDATRVGDQHPGDRRAAPRTRARSPPAGWSRPTAGRRPRARRGSEPSAVPDVVPFSAVWLSARLSRNESGDRTAWVMVSVDGQVGEGAADLGLQPLAELAEVAPQPADLPGHLGELVRTEDDQGHHQDDQHLRRAEERHDPSVPAPGPRRRAVTGPGPRSPGSPVTGSRSGRVPSVPGAGPPPAAAGARTDHEQHGHQGGHARPGHDPARCR